MSGREPELAEPRPTDRKVHYDSLDGEAICGFGKNARFKDRILLASLERNEIPLVTCTYCRNVIRQIWHDLGLDEETWKPELAEFEALWVAHDRQVQSYWLRHYGYDPEAPTGDNWWEPKGRL